MQKLQDLLSVNLPPSKSPYSTPPSPKTDETPLCENEYWNWYYGTDNATRRWAEAHGIKLVMNSLGCPCFVADPDIFFADTKTPMTYPEFFSNRTFDRFVVKLYSYGKNRDMAQEAYDKTVKYVENIDYIIKELGGGGLYYQSKERGTGKTFLSTIAGNELTRRGYPVRWYNMTNLIQEIKAGFDKDSGTSSSDIINRARESIFLILDDIGVEKQSAWLNETVYSILDYRMTHCKPTIFTSNLMPEDLNYDERIIDRITRMTELIKMPDESIRRIMNQRNNLGTFLAGKGETK